MTKELKIEVPRGYEIDLDNSDLSKGIITFKEKYKTLNWKDYKAKVSMKGKTYVDYFDRCDKPELSVYEYDKVFNDHAHHAGIVLPNEEYAKAVVALCKLLLIREEYVEGWKPNWEVRDKKWIICKETGKPKVVDLSIISRPLSFPTKEMAESFLEENKGLIEEADLVL